MNHYPHHIGDFAKKTKGLTLTERGAYRELMDQCYGSEKPLPSDRREVYRMAIAATPAERRAVDYVLGKYFVEKDDGWHNKRVDEEIALYRKRAEQARANGQKGGRRWPDGGTDPGTDPDTGSGGKAGSGSQPGWVPDANQSGKLAVNQNQNSNAVSSESPPKTHPRETTPNRHRNGSENRSATSFADWRVNDQAALRKGESLGIKPNPGEDWPAFRTRIVQVEVERERTTT